MQTTDSSWYSEQILHPKHPNTRCGTAAGTPKGRKGLGTRVEGPELRDKALGVNVWDFGLRSFWA